MSGAPVSGDPTSGPPAGYPGQTNHPYGGAGQPTNPYRGYRDDQLPQGQGTTYGQGVREPSESPQGPSGQPPVDPDRHRGGQAVTDPPAGSADRAGRGGKGGGLAAMVVGGVLLILIAAGIGIWLFAPDVVTGLFD
ncbi:MAG: hypothetical protein ACRDT4_21680 [Micromonosporaceae bacterium]